MIKFVPPEVAAAKSSCKVCGSEFAVPLRMKLDHSLAPVIPCDFDEKTNNRFWQLQAKEIECPNCEKLTLLKLPTVSERGKVLIYGDDAHRTTENGTVYCLSLVGGSYKFVGRMAKEVGQLKQDAEPNRNPDSWKLHMKDLHSGSNRRKHEVFKNWDREKIESVISALFLLVEQNSKDIFAFNVSFHKETEDSSIDEVKKECYIALVADLVYGFSKKGFTPVLHFDCEKEFKGVGPVIHGWARSAFQESQRQLIYSYISHGLPVPEPVFVKPGSHSCLEIADFISFVIARGHFCMMKNITFEYPTEKLGKVFYSWLRKDGHYGRSRQIGFPWEEIYG